MTFRGGEKYSLISYDSITASYDGIITVNGIIQPFKIFKRDFIDEGKTIPLLNTPITGTRTSNYFYNDQDAIGFFDTLHDFKNFFSDCEMNIRGVTTKRYRKFGFSFLLYGGYQSLFRGLGSEILQNDYSYLNRIPRPLNQNNLENYFSIGNIYSAINTGSSNIYILPDVHNYRSVESNIIITQLAELFNNYIDNNFGRKIKLICDMQLSIFEFIERAKDSRIEPFCILYTAETFADPAPVQTLVNLERTFSNDNIYYEVLNGDSSRENNINGNVNVTFSNVVVVDNIRSSFSTDVTYSYDNGMVPDQRRVTANTSNKHINSIYFVEKEIEKTIYKSDLNGDDDTYDNFPLQQSDKSKFYRNFLGDFQRNGVKQNLIRAFSMTYARKRLGDALQGEICKITKLRNVVFRKRENETTTYKATKDAVLLTHDRMLFSRTVSDNMPCILDLGTHIILNIPPSGINGGNGSNNKNTGYVNSIYNNDLNHGKTNKIGGTGQEHNDVNADEFYYYPDVILAYLYSIDVFKDLINLIKNGLLKNEIIYRYHSEFDYDLLCFGTNIDIDNILEIHTKVFNKKAKLRKRERIKKGGEILLYISIDDNTLTVTHHRGGLHTLLKMKGINSRTFLSTNKYINAFLNNHLNTQININDIIDSIYEPVSQNNTNMTIYILSTSICILAIIFFILPKFSGGSGPETSSTDIPTYDKGLNALSTPFEILNNNENFVEKNISIIYHLFILLENYEKSFILYKEGKESFFIKIDEGLPYDLPGNYMPNHIEFYIFIKLLIDEYDESKLSSINYAIFEHYLYSLRTANSIYYRFQDIKSYILNEKVYYISPSKNEVETIDKETRKYFIDICKRTIEISNEIYKQYYDYINNSDYSSIYEMVSSNHLSENGFIEMKNIFINKTIHIIESMLKKGHLTQYIEEATQIKNKYIKSRGKTDLSHAISSKSFDKFARELSDDVPSVKKKSTSKKNKKTKHTPTRNKKINASKRPRSKSKSRKNNRYTSTTPPGNKTRKNNLLLEDFDVFRQSIQV